ncbi:hypothetical protein HELRODRAFT_152689, partial [Helobdella robusta]|uniref:Uncharacterized protein n=1 Tax=Helobdella robusta TaxID=6412 RepID=T1EKV9_HELRO
YYPIVLAGALGYDDIVEILLANNADPYVTINNNMNVLHVAASEGECEVIRVLLDKTKLSVDQVDSNGNTALLYAAKNARIKAIKLLIKHGADLDIRNKQGQSIWDFTM